MRTAARLRRRALALAGAIGLIMLPALAPPASAQQQLGAVQGTITDQTGGVMPGVTVTATNVETGVARTTVSNETGVYRLTGLEPGRYNLSAEIMGFRKVQRTDVAVSVGATLGINFELQAGEVTEMIEVTGMSVDIQTEKADVSAVVEQKKVADLPLVGRNPMALAALQPGIVGIPGGTDFLAAEQGIGINANGQRGSGNTAMVDGITISGGPWGGTVLIVPNVEAVQEFQVIANNASAEFGRNAGGAVSIITKGGTNEFRGTGFEFHRNENLRAKGVFETVKPPFERNDFGVSIGGPIRRDRTFFFASYEGVRETSGSGAVYTVETQQLRDWVFANRPNSIAAQLYRKYPLPQYPTTGLRDVGSPAPGANRIGLPDGIPDLGTINATLTNKRTGDQFNGRVDQTLRDGRDRVRATYYLSEIETQYLYLRPLFNHPYPTRNQLFSTAYTSVLSNSTMNEASFGYVRMHNTTGDPTPDAPTISTTGLSGQAGFGVEYWHPITFTQNNFEFRDVLTMNRGEHSLRMGGEFRYGTDDSVLHHWERPNYSFVSVLDFVDDEPFSETRAVDPATGQSTVGAGEYRTKEWGLFIQDNWKVRPNLTLNLGLRYENFGNPSKENGPFNGIILGSGATRQVQMVTAQAATIDQLWKTDWNNFAPRLGIAWDPKGDATTVFRGGAGVSYNRINNTVFSDERLNPPQFAQATTNIQDPSVPILYTLGPDYPPNPALGRGLDANGGIRGARVALRVVDPETVIPYSYNWFVGVQHQLPWDFVVDLNYVGSAARNLMAADGPGGEDYNRFSGDLRDGVRDRLNRSFASINLAESRISSDYNGMTAQLNRRYKKGFAFQVAYTLGKVEDTRGSAEDLAQRDREKGPADHDIRHVAKANLIWEIPANFQNAALKQILGGWQLNLITVYQSGSAFSVTCTLPYPQCDFNADGTSGERVNTPSFGTDLGDPTNDEWLAGVMKASDFTLPTGGAMGTLPRNAFRGPAYFSSDISLFKNISLPWWGSRDATMQLRFEAFNAFNQINLNNPVSTINSTTFGRVTSARGMRVIQLGAKFIF